MFPGGRFWTKASAALGSDCAHWLPTVLSAFCLAGPSGICCTQATVLFISLAAHCERIEFIAERFSLLFGSALAQANAADESLSPQLEAIA